MIDFIAKYFYYVFLGLILLTVIQRKYKGAGEHKRFATLIISILVFIMYIGALGIKIKQLNQGWILLPFLIDLSLIYVLRSKILIFKKTCQSCGKKLSITDIIYIDSNICSECTDAEKPAAENDTENSDPESNEETLSDTKTDQE